jgi:hypothetical protein
VSSRVSPWMVCLMAASYGIRSETALVHFHALPCMEATHSRRTAGKHHYLNILRKDDDVKVI